MCRLGIFRVLTAGNLDYFFCWVEGLIFEGIGEPKWCEPNMLKVLKWKCQGPRPTPEIERIDTKHIQKGHI